MRILMSMLLVCVIAPAALAQTKKLTTEEDIRKALVGNSISGEENGEVFLEFLNPDGRLVGEGSQGMYTGRWRISYGRMCLSYDEEEGKVTTWDCAEVSLDGASTVIWTSEGKSHSTKLIMGNPSKL
jgi:hypothetical protein